MSNLWKTKIRITILITGNDSTINLYYTNRHIDAILHDKEVQIISFITVVEINVHNFHLQYPDLGVSCYNFFTLGVLRYILLRMLTRISKLHLVHFVLWKKYECCSFCLHDMLENVKIVTTRPGGYFIKLFFKSITKMSMTNFSLLLGENCYRWHNSVS